MADTYRDYTPAQQNDPALGSVAINYTSDQTFTKRVRGLHINVAGTLAVEFQDGSTATLILGIGLWPYSVTKIFNAGSATATGYALI
jgi:hypothetical protein